MLDSVTWVTFGGKIRRAMISGTVNGGRHAFGRWRIIMRFMPLLMMLASCAVLAALAPEAAHAQAVAFPVEEATIADIEAAYMSGRTTARAVTQAHLDRIAAYDK